MSIVMCRRTRRQFLVGAGKTLLALPLLPSLLPRDAWAQAAVANRRLMAFGIPHNVVAEFWPKRTFATTSVGTLGAKEALLSSLGAGTGISPVLAHQLYGTLNGQSAITIVRGLNNDLYGHSIRAWGGNQGSDLSASDNFPTFDTVMEASPSLYPSGTAASVTKAIRMEFGGGTGSSLQKVGSRYQWLPYYSRDDIQTMYKDVFGSLTGGTTTVDQLAAMKANILSKVQDSFLSLKSSRKISSDDIARVDQHLGFISDLQKNYANANMVVANSCSKPGTPATSQDPNLFIPAYLSLMVLAFKCNLTKYGSMSFEGQDGSGISGMSSLVPSGTDMHGAIHGGENQSAWTLKGQVYQKYNEFCYSMIAQNFLAPMNVQEGNTGRTYLDNMLTAVLAELDVENQNGFSGHSNFDMQQVLIGSMGGKLRSGRYFAMPESNGNRLPYNCLVMTLMQLMGIPTSEYASISSTGQGWGRYPSSSGNPYASRFNSALTEMLTGA